MHVASAGQADCMYEGSRVTLSRFLRGHVAPNLSRRHDSSRLPHEVGPEFTLQELTKACNTTHKSKGDLR
jgi:hypothetical protein